MAQNTFVITNRAKLRDGTFGTDPEGRGGLHFLTAPGDYTKTAKKFTEVAQDRFKARLLAELNALKQPNGRASLSVYIHGYNNDFQDALDELNEIGKKLRSAGHDGLTILFTWPSEGQALKYLEDRDDARESTTGFVHLMHLIRDARQPADQCWIDVSFLAHSMGAYVMREGLHYFAKHVGYPAGDIYINEALLLAADIAFDSLEPDQRGWSMSGLAHRITAYFSNHDDILGLSGAKHYGTRRLGRAGPSSYAKLPENCVGIDCSDVNKSGGVHGAYRNKGSILRDMVATIKGTDRAAVRQRVPLPDTDRKGFRIAP